MGWDIALYSHWRRGLVHTRTMHAILILIVVGIVATKQAYADSCSNSPIPIGCSVGDKVPYKQKFTPACRKHDICYSCGADYDISRHRCDDMFKSNMKMACSGFFCSFWIETYYAGVRAFGDVFYKDNPPTWCNEDWVRPCIF